MAETYEVSNAGKTPLQIKQDTEGTPEYVELQKTRLMSDMVQLKKKLIQLKMGAVEKSFIQSKDAVFKSVAAISSMDDLKRQITAVIPDYFKSERKPSK